MYGKRQFVIRATFVAVAQVGLATLLIAAEPSTPSAPGDAPILAPLKAIPAPAPALPPELGNLPFEVPAVTLNAPKLNIEHEWLSTPIAIRVDVVNVIAEDVTAHFKKPSELAAVNAVEETGGRVLIISSHESWHDEPPPPAVVVHMGPWAKDADFRALRYLPQTQHVYVVPGAPITDACLVEIAALPNLRSVGFGGNRAYQSHWLDDVPLADLPRANITADGLRHLVGKTELEELDLMLTRVDDAALEHVAKLRSLRRLDLSITAVTDAGVSQLGELTELRELLVRRTNVRGAGWQRLAKLQKLRLLFVENTLVDDDAVEAIAALRALERLVIGDSPITNAGRAALQKALPDCRIDEP